MARGRAGSPREERELFGLAICGPVIQELLQGLRGDSAFVADYLALPLLSDPMPVRLFRAAADIYRTGRSRGYTIRSSSDCLIAAIALENRVPVWHRDRDYDEIARFTGLEIVRRP